MGLFMEGFTTHYLNFSIDSFASKTTGRVKKKTIVLKATLSHERRQYEERPKFDHIRSIQSSSNNPVLTKMMMTYCNL